MKKQRRQRMEVEMPKALLTFTSAPSGEEVNVIEAPLSASCLASRKLEAVVGGLLRLVTAR